MTVRLLLDTHVLLWSLAQPERLAAPATEAFRSHGVRIVVSVASFWEIAIKQAQGKLAAPANLIDLIRDFGHEILPIRETHAWRVRDLPPHHGDPFDRMLVAQAMVEGLTLMTHDRRMFAYDVPIVRA